MSAVAPVVGGTLRLVPVGLLVWLTAALALAAAVASDGLTLMVDFWLTRPEYSHGVLIPPIAAFLVWRGRHEWREGFTGSWGGPAVVALGLVLWLVGALSAIDVVGQYALAVMIYGVVIALVGPRQFMKLWAPMLMLLLAIPLPSFFYNNLSSELQLISSALGVAAMRSLGISVYLSGNVIDLGHFQMQVVEACDGLRYLFPLMTLGFIVAYFFRAPLWQRALVFLSSIPITIFMNSLRIAMIGVFADYGNTSLAEGLLHELQGWVIFMVSGVLLLGEIWLLVRLFGGGASWRDKFVFEAPPRPEAEPPPAALSAPASLKVAALVLGAALVLSFTLPERADATVERRWFVDFPMTIDGWDGRQGRVEDVYLDFLKLDDYLMADFTDGSNVVNVYSAYYSSQRQQESIHSPRSCIPGGGWRITDLSQVAIGDDGFRANRVLIELGDQKQLVYYWFKQRERELTNEYAVKWYILVDALTKRRTDGALVRFITPVRSGEDIALADARLEKFALAARATMAPYLPD